MKNKFHLVTNSQKLRSAFATHTNALVCSLLSAFCWFFALISALCWFFFSLPCAGDKLRLSTLPSSPTSSEKSKRQQWLLSG
ncbi:hypothetical protein ES319_D08G124200v1 [Gossypium barbadense]|uniref:Uncharacterized protein n=2 Tax=Gossypium TaxID=3633 RepID=A0A5J5QD85_GOSBA|nr:hypothetical protein ES319_D08G124200v1 [Gossypium barbadense]TYG57309.1 hypothetical protein ES288_D08G131900v1 [Gossypium darwinii]